MIRNLKALGLSLVAVCAMGALLVSGASAQFESEEPETQLTVSSNAMQKFKVKAGSSLTVECNTVATENTVVEGEATTTITSHPVYSNCEDLLGQEVNVTTTGCDYVFHLADNATTGTTDVECSGGNAIKIDVGSLCTYSIGTQTGLSSVSYKNIGSGTTREVEIIPAVTGITSSKSGSFLCPGGSSEGTYEGALTVTGEIGGGHVGIFVD